MWEDIVANALLFKSADRLFGRKNQDPIGDTNIKSLMDKLKGKDFKGMRQWVVNNIDTEPHAIFRAVYDKMADHLQPQSIPQVVIILADYQYKNAFVADHEMNVVACMTEIMAGAEWK